MRNLQSLSAVFLGLISIVLPSETSGSGNPAFVIYDRGGARFDTLSEAAARSSVTAGYGVIQPGQANTTPAGLAIFSYRANGVLVSEAGVPASPLLQSGRTYAELNGPVNTGLAIANPNAAPVLVSFYFTGADGQNFGSGSFTLAPGEQIARFISEAPFSASFAFAGTFTFSASAPVGVVALRGRTNGRGEFLVSTQTVTSLPGAGAGDVYVPYFADGGGWTSQVILVNPGDAASSGRATFFDQGAPGTPASPITMNVNGQVGSSFDYSIPPRGSVRLQTSNPPGATRAGSVRIVPDFNSISPSASVVFSFARGGIVVSEAAVRAQPAGSTFRMYVEASGTPGQADWIESGIALTNTSPAGIAVTLELTTLDGASQGTAASVVVPPSGQVARFLRDFFPSLSISFQGVLRISATGPVSVAGLRTRYNERGDFLVTTTPPSDSGTAPGTAPLVFPHLAVGGGYATRLILFSGSTGQAAAGTLRLLSQAGVALSSTFDASVAYDDFERASVGPDWNIPVGNVVGIVNNSDVGLIAPGGAGLLEWAGAAFAADQFSQTRISDDIVSNMLAQVFVRRASDNARYGFHWNDVTSAFELKYDGVPRELTRIMASVPAPQPRPGDTIRLEISGNTLTGYLNGVPVLSAVDTAIQAPGRPGLVFRLVIGGTTTYPSPVGENWLGGSLR